MNAYARDNSQDHIGSGFAGAIALHVLLAAALIGAAYVGVSHNEHWGENSAQMGAIQASMVSAIPLPQKAPPVKDQVLTPDDVSPAPVPPPKEATQPPPKPTDILVKGRTTAAKAAPIVAPAPPKHPQPVPDTKKAASGESATQLPQSIAQLQNGTATVTVQDRTFGNRYAYYVQIVSRTVAQNWYSQEADPRSSQGKRASIVFDIERDGTIANAHLEGKSGSPTLDASVVHALQRIDGFGPLPSGDHITVEYTFDYRKP
jgi:protein TonB